MVNWNWEREFCTWFHDSRLVGLAMPYAYMCWVFELAVHWSKSSIHSLTKRLWLNGHWKGSRRPLQVMDRSYITWSFTFTSYTVHRLTYQYSWKNFRIRRWYWVRIKDMRSLNWIAFSQKRKVIWTPSPPLRAYNLDPSALIYQASSPKKRPNWYPSTT